MDRRAFLKAVGAGIAVAPTLTFGASLPTVIWARRGADEARLNLAVPEDWRHFNWLLRDVRANVSSVMSPKLAYTLCWMQAWLGAYGVLTPMVFTSGLRTPATNDATEGAVRGSRHLLAADGFFHAADCHTPAVNASYLASLANLAGQGGVGLYPDNGFVHTDDGPRRTWLGRVPRHK